MKWKRLNKEQPPRDGREIILKTIDKTYLIIKSCNNGFKDIFGIFANEYIQENITHWIDPSEIQEG